MSYLRKRRDGGLDREREAESRERCDGPTDGVDDPAVDEPGGKERVEALIGCVRPVSGGMGRRETRKRPDLKGVVELRRRENGSVRAEQEGDSR